MLFRIVLIFWYGIAVLTARNAYAVAEQEVHLYATKSLTLAESIDYALQHYTSLVNARIDVSIQEQKNKLYVSEVLPQIAYTGRAQYFTRIPSVFVPDFVSPAVYAILQANRVKSGNGNTITMPQHSSVDGTYAAFNTKWNVDQNISISQILYDNNIFIAMESTKALKELATANLNMEEDKVKANVAQLYFSLVILEKRKSLIDTMLMRMQNLYSETEKLVRDGFREHLDIDRIAVQLARLQTIQNQLSNATKMMHANFKQSIGLDQNIPIVLSTPADERLADLSMIFENITDYDKRSDFRSLEVVRHLKNLDVKRNKLSYFPVVSAYGNVGYRDLSNNFSVFGPFSFPNDFWGVQVRWDIFGGFKKLRSLKIARMEYQKINNLSKQSKELIGIDIDVRKKKYTTAVNNLLLQKTNIALAEKVYKIMKQKYDNGMASGFELIAASNEWDALRDTFYQALLEVINERILFKKAIGRLDAILE